MVTSVVLRQEGERHQQRSPYQRQTERKREEEKKIVEKEALATSEEIKMQKGAEQNCQRLMGPVSKIDVAP